MDIGKMDPDLMGAPRSEHHLEEGVPARKPEPPEFCYSLTAARDHRHPLPVLRIAADRCLDARRGISHLADHDRPVSPGDDPPLQLAGQLAMRLVISRHDHQARGIAVQPVHDAGPLRAADRRPARAATQQSVDQRAGGMTRPRVHDEAGRFVDDDQVVVLVEDREIHRFGLKPGWNRGRQLPVEAIAGSQPATGPRRPIVEADVPLRDQALDLASTLSGEQAGEVLVESGSVDRDRVRLRRGQTGLERPLRQIVPKRSTATPTLIAESATLKIGQCGTWMKSMTEPLTPRS